VSKEPKVRLSPRLAPNRSSGLTDMRRNRNASAWRMAASQVSAVLRARCYGC
jgi:hypothetical protein